MLCYSSLRTLKFAVVWQWFLFWKLSVFVWNWNVSGMLTKICGYNDLCEHLHYMLSLVFNFLTSFQCLLHLAFLRITRNHLETRQAFVCRHFTLLRFCSTKCHFLCVAPYFLNTMSSILYMWSLIGFSECSSCCCCGCFCKPHSTNVKIFQAQNISSTSLYVFCDRLRTNKCTHCLEVFHNKLSIFMHCLRFNSIFFVRIDSISFSIYVAVQELCRF